jgi:hypothetical protein
MEYISSIITGLVTALSLAVIAFCWNSARSKWLEWRIKNVIRKHISKAGCMRMNGAKLLYNEAGVKIDNDFYLPITIRSVWANFGTEHRLSLIYNGPEIENDILPCTESSEDNIYGFVKLPAYTNGKWVMYASRLQKQKHLQNHATSYTIHLEYLTLFNVPKVIKVEIDKPESLFAINKLIDEYNCALNQSKTS